MKSLGWDLVIADQGSKEDKRRTHTWDATDQASFDEITESGQCNCLIHRHGRPSKIKRDEGVTLNDKYGGKF